MLEGTEDRVLWLCSSSVPRAGLEAVVPGQVQKQKEGQGWGSQRPASTQNSE